MPSRWIANFWQQTKQVICFHHCFFIHIFSTKTCFPDKVGIRSVLSNSIRRLWLRLKRVIFACFSKKMQCMSLCHRKKEGLLCILKKQKNTLQCHAFFRLLPCRASELPLQHARTTAFGVLCCWKSIAVVERCVTRFCMLFSCWSAACCDIMFWWYWHWGGKLHAFAFLTIGNLQLLTLKDTYDCEWFLWWLLVIERVAAVAWIMMTEHILWLETVCQDFGKRAVPWCACKDCTFCAWGMAKSANPQNISE